MIYDVIIIGSGPGGAVAAATLAQHGKSVLLVDRQAFPRDKICGDGIPQKAMKMIHDDFGIDISQSNLKHQRIYGISIDAPSGQNMMIPEYSKTHYSMVSPRLYFDNMLHEYALKCGAKFEVMHVAAPLYSNVDEESHRVFGIVERKGKELVEHEARVVIAAGGATSPIATSLRGRVSEPKETAIALRAYAHIKQALPSNPLVYFKYLADLTPGYAWIFPTSPDEVNIGLGLFDQVIYKKHGKSLKLLLNEFVEEIQSSFPLEIAPNSAKSWPIPVWTTDESRVIKGVYLVGDAGRFVDALTGGGIFPAMITGQLAARSVVNFLEGMPEHEANFEYDQNWRNGIGRSLRKNLLVQNFVASKPFVFNSIFAISIALPSMKGNILRALAGQHV